MNAIESALLGIVQGLTEFFPVSGSGHLAMAQALFGGREAEGLLFEVAVHVATLVAIVIFYRQKILELIVGFFTRQREALEYVGKLALGSVPAGLVGVTANDFISEQFSNPILVGIALLVTGCVVFSTRWTSAKATALVPSWGVAFAIGCAQAFAILPGISRSGSTVAIALALGIAPLAAAEFSFLLGVIAVSGAAVLMLPDLAHAEPEALASIGVGFATALISGILAIWLFVKMLDKSLFHHWAWYCWAAGGAFLIWSLA